MKSSAAKGSETEARPLYCASLQKACAELFTRQDTHAAQADAPDDKRKTSEKEEPLTAHPFPTFFIIPIRKESLLLHQRHGISGDNQFFVGGNDINLNRGFLSGDFALLAADHLIIQLIVNPHTHELK